jgi:hypothetical protein
MFFVQVLAIEQHEDDQGQMVNVYRVHYQGWSKKSVLHPPKAQNTNLFSSPFFGGVLPVLKAITIAQQTTQPIVLL